MRLLEVSLSILALFALLYVQIPQGSAQAVPIGSCGASRSTWFADNQHGACLYGPSLGPTGNGNFLICASSMLVFDNSADCGACYQITGPNGTSVIVTVVDQCTDGGVCDTTFPHLDLSPQAFDTLADPTVSGVIDTNVQRVACPVQGNLKLRVGSNFFSSTSWEILIFNHRLPITTVTFTYAGLSSPVSLPRQTYNYWRYDGPAVTVPVTISVTDTLGDVVSFQPLTLSSGLIVESNNQYPVPSAFPGSSENGCPAPPPVAVSTGGWIYEDSLTKEYTDTDVSYINTFQWSDWSYGSTINWASTSDPYSGSDCVQAVIGNPGAIQIGQATSFSWSAYFTSLQFAIRGSSAYNGISVGWKSSVQVPVSVTTSWQLITLDLSSDLHTPTQIGGQVVLAFQNNFPQTTTIFLDNIRLIPVSTLSSSTASSSSSHSASSSTSAASTSTSSSSHSASSSTSAASTSVSSSTSTSTSTTAHSTEASTSFPSSSSTTASTATSSTAAGLHVLNTNRDTTTTTTAASSTSLTSSAPTIPMLATTVGTTHSAIIFTTTTALNHSTSASTSTGQPAVNPSTSTTTGSSPSNPVPSCTVTLSQTVAGSWSDSTTQYTQWSVSLMNNSPDTLVSVSLQPNSSPESQITQLWSMINSSNLYSFPSWVVASGGLPSRSSFPWGYIATGNSPIIFSVLSAVCE